MSLPPPPDPPDFRDRRAPGSGPDPGSGPGLSATDRRTIEQRIRMDRLRTVGLILGISALIIGGTVTSALVGAAGLYLFLLPIGVALLIGWLTRRQRGAAESATEAGPAAPAATEGDPEPDGTTFPDIAFSDEPPTWRGWPRDVGVARIRPDRVTVAGPEEPAHDRGTVRGQRRTDQAQLLAAGRGHRVGRQRPRGRRRTWRFGRFLAPTSRLSPSRSPGRPRRSRRRSTPPEDEAAEPRTGDHMALVQRLSSRGP